MTIEEKNEFVKRVNAVEQNDTAKFGRMNVNQMICHCTDQLRMALGELKGLHRENVDMAKIREMRDAGKSLPTVDGLDQVGGQGTKPTTLDNDKQILISYIEKFISCGDEFPFHFHPFMGDMNKEKWDRLVVYHLNHHLGQFGR